MLQNRTETQLHRQPGSSCNEFMGLLSTIASSLWAISSTFSVLIAELNTVHCLWLLICMKILVLAGRLKNVGQIQASCKYFCSQCSVFYLWFLCYCMLTQTQFTFLKHGEWQSCFKCQEAYGLACLMPRLYGITMLSAEQSIQGFFFNVALYWRRTNDTWNYMELDQCSKWKTITDTAMTVTSPNFLF